MQPDLLLLRTLDFLADGITGATVWQMALYCFVMIHVTFMGITLFLHRDQTHRGVDLAPPVRHFFRFWLWVTTGTVTKEWVAVHRKHHARCETAEDPHSPVVEGIGKVLLEGAELYREETAKPETLSQYGRGTPDDWLERELYTPHSVKGVYLMAAIDLLLFGAAGMVVWAVQMAAQPFFAAGVINGLGHWTGYRNFESEDAAKNIVPIGFLITGEELHNNHHAFPSSARFSVQPWEFDVGWLYIKLLSAVGLAEVRRVWPAIARQQARDHLAERQVDLDNLRTVIVARMHVLRDYSRKVTVPVLKAELAQASEDMRQRVRAARRALLRRPALLDAQARARLEDVLARSRELRLVHEAREQLKELWSGTNVSNDKLLAQFREWCARAEASGNRYLEDFARSLRGYSLQPA